MSSAMDIHHEETTTGETSSESLPRPRRGTKRPSFGPGREIRTGRRTRRRLDGEADPQPSTQSVVSDVARPNGTSSVVFEEGSSSSLQPETGTFVDPVQEDSVARDKDNDVIVVTHPTSRFCLPLKTSTGGNGKDGVRVERTGGPCSKEDHSPLPNRSQEVVSSRSLSLILNDDREVRPSSLASPTRVLSAVTVTPIPSDEQSSHSHPKGKGKQKAEERAPTPEAETSTLADYTCPICFSPPTNATLTPCGHICCGSCLFAAVKSSMKRAQYAAPEDAGARCPVCRASISGWDGKGGGVIGLKIRTLFTL